MELGLEHPLPLDEYWAQAQLFPFADTEAWLLKALLAAVSSIQAAWTENIRGIIGQVKALIRKNYADSELSLSMVAATVYLSPSYLSKLFRKETGETYVDYVARVRMEEAQRLLRETNLRSVEVGAQVGYPNAQYFSFLFKKHTGLSPIEYREQGVSHRVRP